MRRERTWRMSNLLRPLASMLLVVGMVLGGAPSVLAADPPDPPKLLSVSLKAPTSLMVNWALTGTKPADGVRVNIFKSGEYVLHVSYPSKRRNESTEFTRIIPNLEPNVRYCAGLLAFVGTGDNGSSTFSEESDRLCFTSPAPGGSVTDVGPAPKPSGGEPKPAPKPEAPPRPDKPDLEIFQVSGPTELFSGTTGVYEISLWNNGTAVKNGVMVQIGGGPIFAVEEVLEATNGFTCEANDFGFACVGVLGGLDDPGQTRGARIRVRARGNEVGEGHLVASANHDRAFEEMTVDNNLHLYKVTVK